MRLARSRFLESEHKSVQTYGTPKGPEVALLSLTGGVTTLTRRRFYPKQKVLLP